MKCPECNQELPEGSQSCTSCGKNLTIEAVTETVAETATQATETATQATETATDAVETATDAVETAKETPLVTDAKDLVEGKKKSKKLIIGGAVVAVAAVAVAAFAFTSKDPKTVVIDAFKSVYSSEIQYPFEEIFGMKELTKLTQTENTEIDFNLKLTNSSDEQINSLAGTGITSTSVNDMVNKKSAVTLGVEYAGLNLLNMNLYMDKSTLVVAVPELTNKAFTMNYADDLAGQIETSPLWGPMMSESGMDANALVDYMNYVTDIAWEKQGQIIDVKALWERYKTGSKAIDDFKAAMTVQKADKKTFTIDGKETKCSGYEAVVTKDAFIQLIKTTSQFMLEDETAKKEMMEYWDQVTGLSQGMAGSEYMEDGTQILEQAKTELDQMIAILEKSLGDIKMTVYVDKKGRMTALDAVTTIVNEEDATDTMDVLVHMELKGGTYLTQNVESTVTLTDGEEAMTFDIKKQGSYDKALLTSDLFITAKVDDEEVSFTYTGTYDVANGSYHMELIGNADGTSLDISAMGAVENLVKGKSMDFVFDSIKVTVDDTDMIEFAGLYAIRPMVKEAVIPEGIPMDIFAATEEEWQATIEEVSTSLGGMMMQLQ